MAVILSALRTVRALLHRNIIFLLLLSFLLEAEQIPGSEKNSFTSSGLETTTFRLVA
jgi:hypothetical protein